MRDLKPLTEAETAELLDWVSACQSSYHIDSTPGHRFGGLGSHLQENRDSLVEYVNALIAARAQPAQAVPSDVVRDAERWRTFLATRPANTHAVINDAIDAAMAQGEKP